MAEKQTGSKKSGKNKKADANALQKTGAFFGNIGKRFKKFFSNLKAELKRVIWPDKKRLLQSTATVLFICLIAAIILFVVDTFLSTVLQGVGFYSPKVESTITETVDTSGEGA